MCNQNGFSGGSGPPPTDLRGEKKMAVLFLNAIASKILAITTLTLPDIKMCPKTWLIFAFKCPKTVSGDWLDCEHSSH